MKRAGWEAEGTETDAALSAPPPPRFARLPHAGAHHQDPTSQCPLGLMDKAADFQFEDCGVESRRGWFVFSLAAIGRQPWNFLGHEGRFVDFTGVFTVRSARELSNLQVAVCGQQVSGARLRGAMRIRPAECNVAIAKVRGTKQGTQRVQGWDFAAIFQNSLS